MTGEAFPAPATGGHSHVERVPAPALRDLASSVWVQQVDRAAAPYVHRRVPSGAAELVCRVGARPRLIGPRTEPLVEVLDPGTTVVGIRFVPGAVHTLTGHPASELTEMTLDAGELWGRSATALSEAINTSPSPKEALTAAQLHMQRRAATDNPPDPIVSEAVHKLTQWHTADVTSLSTSLHISETQLRRRCRTAVGLAPKALHRILRFQGFVALVQQAIAQHRTPTPDGLGLLALRVGYADQSHLTRECVRLTGVPPGMFIAETQRTCARGHDHSATFTPVLRAGTKTSPSHE